MFRSPTFHTSNRSLRGRRAVELRCTLAVIAGVLFGISLEAQPQQPTDDDNNPYRASAVVHGRVTTFMSWRDYCAKEDPSSAQTFAAAVDTWLERHSRLYEKTLQIMRSAFTKDELAALEEDVRASADEFQLEMEDLSREERLTWCQSTPAAILSPRMSLLQRAQLVAALENFGAEN
jgi:hypothetical protein